MSDPTEGPGGTNYYRPLMGHELVPLDHCERLETRLEVAHGALRECLEWLGSGPNPDIEDLAVACRAAGAVSASKPAQDEWQSQRDKLKAELNQARADLQQAQERIAELETRHAAMKVVPLDHYRRLEARWSRARERIAELGTRSVELGTRSAAMLETVRAAVAVVDSEDPANAKALTLYVPADAWGRLVAAVAPCSEE